jgi:hypothetical protein
MNGIIRYKINLFPSKRLPYKFLYSIKSRDTLYGIHKETINDHSKTSLILFIEKQYALRFKNHLEEKQQNHISFDRTIILEDDYYISNKCHTNSIMPLHIQKRKTSDLELMSLIHYFDILIVSKVELLDNDILSVYGFDYTMKDVPSRSLVEYQLRQTLNPPDK